jgi:hypothetical protein
VGNLFVGDPIINSFFYNWDLINSWENENLFSKKCWLVEEKIIKLTEILATHRNNFDKLL